MAERKRRGMRIIIVTVIFILVVIPLFVIASSRQLIPFAIFPTPTRTPEPIVPTMTPNDTTRESPNVEYVTALPTTAEPSIEQTAEPIIESTVESPVVETRQSKPITALEQSDLLRFGVGIPGGLVDLPPAEQSGLKFGSYLTWNHQEALPDDGRAFWQMIRIDEAGIRLTTWDFIERSLAANPGSYWLVGNEPDVPWQDNVTPQRYAEIYHDIYNFIKERDSTAKVVIGGVSQPTQLRRDYLDIILDSYLEKYGEEMPIDVWNVHTFILREERGSWGVDIPPGMDIDVGELYEIDDHDNLEILRQNLIDFRAWMADRGFADKPLLVSEYGILMPEDYGFSPNVVGEFLTGSFDIFLTEANETGYEPDNSRLVQWWIWYSLYDGVVYPTGNLIDPSTGKLTPVGETWNGYIDELLAGS